MPSMTKSALQVARDALAAGEASLAPYASRFSRRDDTRPQLFALLVLRRFLRTDGRGVVALASGWRELREAPRLARVPHASTPAHAAPRLMAGAEKRGDVPHNPGRTDHAGAGGRLGRRQAGGSGGRDRSADPRHVSAHFGLRRAGGRHRQRAWLKLTAVVHTASPLIVGAVPGTGPSQDSPDFVPAMRQAAKLISLDTAPADAGHDAEHNHRLCCEEPGLRRSVIALNPRNAGQRPPTTPHRHALWQDFPSASHHQPWQVESTFSQHKRRLGSALSACRSSA